MRTHGHTPVWGNHIAIGRTKKRASWYEEIKEWWSARKTARDAAKLAAIAARWDAKGEALKPLRADAAPEMAAAHHAISVATMLYGLSS
jgi:hypothetical protein